MLSKCHTDENNEKAANGAGVNDWHGGGGHGGGGGGGGHGGGGGGCRYGCCHYGSHGCARCCSTPDEVPQQVKN